MQSSVMAQVAVLPDKSTDELKRMWRDLYDSDPPPYNRAFLIKRLGYRLQELSIGGLSETARKRLDAMAADPEYGDPVKMHRKQTGRPIAGTRLIREWRGVEHQVTVLDDGFEYQGQRYKSLSVIARTITGTRWSGPVFFGLRRSGGSK